MTGAQHLKAELMLYAIHTGYFSYFSSYEKRKDGKYKVFIDGEKTLYTLTELAEDFDNVRDEDKTRIVQMYLDDILIGEKSYAKV